MTFKQKIKQQHLLLLQDKIDVYQETINQYIPEYLVNFTYFNRIIENYGFALISKAEAEQMDFPSGSGMFDDLYRNMIGEIKRNRIKEIDCGTAAQMNSFEKQISFLNRYYIYKKIRKVNPDKVEIDLSDYNFKRGEEEPEPSGKKDSVVISEKDIIVRTKKIRKLNKKLMLQPATEALEPDETELKAAQEAETKAAQEAAQEAETKAAQEAELKAAQEAEAKAEAKAETKAEAKAETKAAKTKKAKKEKEEKKEEPIKPKLKFRIIPSPEEDIDHAFVKTKKTLKNKKVTEKAPEKAAAKEEKATEKAEKEEKAAEKAEPGEKKKRCPNGTRKNIKTGDCEKKNA